MPTVTNLMIGIGAEYKGKPAFNKADKQIAMLNKSVGILAKRFISLYAAQKLFSEAKQAVKAYAADDLAARKLTKTLDNLGMAYEATNVSNLIADMERSYHVADDFLRPAFSKLISTTQSFTKSEELLKLALDASSGAGVGLETTVSDLAQAYVGNLKGLKKYNLGFTNAELATKSFDEIQQIVTNRFKGQAAQAADTYAGKMDALAIATGNAQEIIGEGLVNALSDMVGKKGDVENLAQTIEDLASALNSLIAPIGFLMKYSGLGLLTKGLAGLGSKGFKDFAKSMVFGNENSLLEARYGAYDPTKNKVPDLPPETIKILLARKKLDDLAAKRQRDIAAYGKKILKLENERLATKKAQAALDKANRALDFAGTIFDLDKIQLYAALQGKITAEDRDRLTLKLLLLTAENQTGEALTKSAQEATVLSQKILMNNGLVMTYDGIIKNLATAKNPFEGFDAYTKAVLENIRQIQLALDKLKMPSFGGGGGGGGSPVYLPPGFEGFGPPNSIISSGAISLANYQDAFARPNTANSFTNGGPGNTFTSSSIGGVGNPMGNYSTVVNVNAGTIANPQEIQDIVQNAIQNANRSGNSTNYAGQLGF